MIILIAINTNNVDVIIIIVIFSTIFINKTVVVGIIGIIINTMVDVYSVIIDHLISKVPNVDSAPRAITARP